MRNRWLWCGVALFGGLCFLMGSVVAQEESKKPGAGPGAMPGWMMLTKEHAGLRKLVGEWDSEWRFWMAPDAPPSQGKGSARAKLIHGGRFLRQEYKSTMMGQPFEGLLFLGYDTIDKEFVLAWMDSMSPVMSISRGKERDGAVRLYGWEPDHETGKKRKMLSVVRWAGDDRYTVTSYTIGEDGTETRAGEISYTRKP
ncbi:MAG: DUF1579 domain-containing protein [Planctomycetota bacterium]|jgi:hypothetical protein